MENDVMLASNPNHTMTLMPSCFPVKKFNSYTFFFVRSLFHSISLSIIVGLLIMLDTKSRNLLFDLTTGQIATEWI